MYSDDDLSDYEEEKCFDHDPSWISNDESLFGLNQINRVIIDQDLSMEKCFSDDDPLSDTYTSHSNGNSPTYLSKEISSSNQNNVSPVSYHQYTSTTFTPRVKDVEDRNATDSSSINFPNISEGSAIFGSTGSSRNLQNSAFSSALLNYCMRTSNQTSDISTVTENTGNSRYSRALQLLRNKKSQEGESAVHHTHFSPTDENSSANPSSESEGLYDRVCNGLPQEYNRDRFLIPEYFTLNQIEADDVSNELITPNDISQSLALRETNSANFTFVEKKAPKDIVREDKCKVGRCNLQKILSFDKLKSQINVFHLRVKVANYSHALTFSSLQNHKPSSLEVYLEKIKSSSIQSDLIANISLLCSALKSNENLANSFLAHYVNYIQSVIDLESSLISIGEFIVNFLPCVEVVMRGKLATKVIEEIKHEVFLPLLFNSLKKMISQETKFSQTTISDLLEFKQKCIVKAHIVRMQPAESQKLFQETFSDVGNLTDLYLIYIWRILRLYEFEEGDISESSVVCLSETMERSGRFISIVSIKELNEKESKIQFLQTRESSVVDEEPSQVASDFNFEWADLRIGQVFGNGVVFLTNMSDWQQQLKEISISIDKLEVKKCVKFLPALGSTYGLHLEDGLKILNKVEDVSYIRVRVVRVAGPLARVYGIDTGAVLVSEVAHLILLPASLLNTPPCGRLAHLPVVPAPNAAAVSPTLNLLVALTRHTILAQDLSSVDVRGMTVWMQVPELTLPVLHLLKAMLKTSLDTPLMNDICTLITDYLVRVTHKQIEDTTCTYQAISILISAMQTSTKVRLLLAKEGAFVTLCDLGLKVGDQQIWDVLRMLLGGKGAMESWLSVSSKISQIRNKRNFKPWRLETNQMMALSKQNGDDPSLAVLRIASMPTLDRNWDLEVRSTIHSRQLFPYVDPSGWCWKKPQVLTANIGDLHYGHKLDIQNDETHHIILDKSVPNIRMNTLLQIILGMLNTGLGGKIYIGLNNLGIVQGVRMTRDQRDCFMLGFSKLVTSEIFPMVLPCDSLIQFIPVVRAGLLLTPGQSVTSGSTSLTLESASFVVILTVRPQPNLLYRYRSDPEPVLIREGGVTSTIKGHRLTHLNATLTTRNHHLQKQVSLEKQALVKLILLIEAQDT